MVEHRIQVAVVSGQGEALAGQPMVQLAIHPLIIPILDQVAMEKPKAEEDL